MHSPVYSLPVVCSQTLLVRFENSAHPVRFHEILAVAVSLLATTRSDKVTVMAAAVVRGIGSNLSKNLREIRLHICQTSAASQGARDFIEQHYVPLKKSNPDFPILIRECSGVQPKLWARYGFGKEHSVSLDNMNVDQVGKTLETLINTKP
ncbi:NADH dehydrogenase [ubiquinone] 1 alpha subcomplex subunit 2 [Misgurnus anguillicaudatus]|uniref:NADH dehydrogenase [ubiquinone] 1 alpha subcomplex subunit 2 n=1 Tax=Misgurnus anguillicaudatus TaxID=75329 RepID=UPI003CCEFFC8